VDGIVSCADHEGVPRALLAAFKFRGLTGLADLIAGFMADAVGAAERDLIVIPVPPASLRTWVRGFDPVAMLATRVAVQTGLPEPSNQVLRRHGSRRQRGRGRGRRLADPPDIRPLPDAGKALGGRSVLLVDDVITTGSTLEATAAAARKAGSDAVRALTFTRRL
jgi:predicted amidophosphoribosyltransferase